MADRVGGPKPSEASKAGAPSSGHPSPVGDAELRELQHATTRAAAAFFEERSEGDGLREVSEEPFSRMSTGEGLLEDAVVISAPRSAKDHIGLCSRDYTKFADKAVDLHFDAYISTLEGEGLDSFRAMAKPDQEDAVFNWLTDPERTLNNEKPRLEFRQCPKDPTRIANVALCCADKKARESIYPHLVESKVAEGLSLVQAGSTTIEIASDGVNKSTPIKYLQQPGVFTSILDHIGYRPGPYLNARETPSVVIADADGTIWEKPKSGQSAETDGLLNSPARDSIIGYLKAGGVLVINTGNDPMRTVRRLLPGFAGLSDAEQASILSRIIIASGGGGSFSCFIEGEFTEYPDYHHFDPSTPGNSETLDMLYIGDDPKMKGNDMPAFIASEDHFICVAEEEKSETVTESGIEKRAQFGEVKSSHAIFTALTIQAKLNRAAVGAESATPPLFSDMEALLANTRHITPASEIVESTLERLGTRSGVDEAVLAIDRLNAPGKFKQEDAKSAMEALPPPVEGEELTYEAMNRRIGSMKAPGEEKVRTPLDVSDADGASATSEAQAMVRSFVRETDIAAQSAEGPVTLRILEPGNNDQSTPIFIAHQIRLLREEVAREGGNVDNLNIQVLVMGKGGHATTALFPQIGQMRDKDFSGTEEAISLGGTLKRALEEAHIPVEVVRSYQDELADPKAVSIKLEKDSTNTGENVKNALKSSEEEKPAFQWVISAKTQALRQALTFAHQYEKDGEKAYDTLWSMPLPRGEGFIRRSLSDYQAVTEFYCGMAENARLVNYALKPGPYIPPLSRDSSEFMAVVDNLYETYAQLEGVPVEDAKRDLTIGNLQKYFGDKFTTLEQSIPWSKREELQEGFTKASMSALKREKNANTVRSALRVLGKFDERGVANKDISDARTLLIAALRGEREVNLVAVSERVIRCFQEAFPGERIE